MSNSREPLSADHHGLGGAKHLSGARSAARNHGGERGRRRLRHAERRAGGRPAPRSASHRCRDDPRRPVNGQSSTAISSPTPPCVTRITVSKPPCAFGEMQDFRWRKSARSNSISIRRLSSIAAIARRARPSRRNSACPMRSPPLWCWATSGRTPMRTSAIQSIARLESCVTVEANPSRVRRGAKLSIDVDGTNLTESVDDIAGDMSNPMTKDHVAEKFRRYTEPALGRQRAEALVGFLLEGDSAEPARKCLSSGELMGFPGLCIEGRTMKRPEQSGLD